VAAYEERIVFVLAKAHQRALGIMNRTLQPYGLTPIQYLILGALWEEEGLTAGANEEILGDFTVEEKVLLKRLLRDVKG